MTETYLRNCVLHDLLVRHIALVAYEQLVDTICSVSVNLLQPLLDVVERVHVRNIVDDADAMGASVVGRGDGSEAFLSRGIPLAVNGQRRAQTHAAALDLTICNFTVLPSSSVVRIFCAASVYSTLDWASSTYEINTNSRDVALRVCIIGEPQQQAGLPNTRVPDEEELEEVVVSVRARVRPRYDLEKGIDLQG